MRRRNHGRKEEKGRSGQCSDRRIGEDPQELVALRCPKGRVLVKVQISRKVSTQVLLEWKEKGPERMYIE